MRPRHPGPDANQPAIMEAVRDVPRFEIYDVSSLSEKVCPGDVLVLCKPLNRWQLFEIKMPGGKISDEQQRRDDDGSVPIVYTAVEIIEFFI